MKQESNDFSRVECQFTLTTGEEVGARAVLETPDGTLFIACHCLSDEQRMFKDKKSAVTIDYEHSDLRKKLNTEILDTFPDKIKRHMICMQVENTNEFDMLRIPTEHEIFGENRYGKCEHSQARRFYGMEKQINRIAFLGNDPCIEAWYWLQNKVKDSNYQFVFVGELGTVDYTIPEQCNGVRLVFTLA